MQILSKAILPGGFLASGIYCGIKKSKSKDLGLIYSRLACACTGMFTANKVKSASLLVCKNQLKKSGTKARAIIVNSGNANCFVGKKGIDDALDITRALSKQLGVLEDNVLIASTGIIGKPLPLKNIKQSLPKLCLNLNKDGLRDFTDAILTTDTFRKNISVKIKIKNKPVLITGVAKGAGMIYPKLELTPCATMLVFILTDASIKRRLLELALKEAVDGSFNRISVDGCMSTNDTVLTMANGAADNIVISKRDKKFKEFSSGLFYICETLARMVISDAEGATKLIEILVSGAKNKKEAQISANAVANSSLFKSAMFGANPNWGRIVSAIGAYGVVIDENKLEISFNNMKVFQKGKAYYPDNLRNSLKRSDTIYVGINLNTGNFAHKVLTSDLTPEYVKINAEYS